MQQGAVQLAQTLMVQHATAPLQPDAAAAGLQQLQQALSSSSSSSGGAGGVLLAVSHKVAADLALVQVRLQLSVTVLHITPACGGHVCLNLT
jgi:hypothetical protein